MRRSVDRRAGDDGRAQRTNDRPKPRPGAILRRMPNDTAADLVLSGGRIFTGDAAKPRGEALAGSADRRGRRDATSAAASGPRTRVIELSGRPSRPASRTATSTRSAAASTASGATSTARRAREAYLDAIAAYAAVNPDLEWILGGGWSMADFPAACAARTSTGSSPTGRVFPNRDGHDVWVNTRRWSWPGSTGTRPTRTTDGSRDPDGTPMGTLHEGAMRPRRPAHPRPRRTSCRRGLLESQAYLHGLGITDWQDAIVTPARRRPTSRWPRPGELTARVVGALWWDAARAWSRSSRSWSGARTGRWAATRDEREADVRRDHREPDRLDAPAVLRRPRARRPTTAGQGLHRPGVAARARRRGSTRPGSRRTSTRSATGPCARRWTPSRPPGRQRLDRHAAAPRPHPGDPPRRPPAFRRLGALANAQPLWAVLEDQM